MDNIDVIITRDDCLNSQNIDENISKNCKELYNILYTVFIENPTYNKILAYTIEKPLNKDKLLEVDGLCLGVNNNINFDDLPSNIKYLFIGLPTTINLLVEGISLNSLPINLEHLYIQIKIKSPLDNLPNNLISLFILSEYEFPLNNLPWSLKCLKVSGGYNIPLINLPPNLVSLMLSEYYHIELTNLPLTLEYLYIGINYFEKLDLSYLTQLEELEIEGSPVIQKLPETLNKLTIGFEASPKIAKLNDNLENINTYYHKLNLLESILDIHCPKKLQNIVINSIYRNYIAPTIFNEEVARIQHKYNNQFTISIDD